MVQRIRPVDRKDFLCYLLLIHRFGIHRWTAKRVSAAN